jgi:hypothetical protein
MPDDIVRHPETGKALEKTDRDYVFRCPDSGQMFCQSPLSGTLLKIGPGSHKVGGRLPKVLKEAMEELGKDIGTYAKLAQLCHHHNPAIALRPTQRSAHEERVTILLGGVPLGFEQIPEGKAEVLDDVEGKAEPVRDADEPAALPAPPKRRKKSRPDRRRDRDTGGDRDDPTPDLRPGSALRED